MTQAPDGRLLYRSTRQEGRHCVVLGYDASAVLRYRGQCSCEGSRSYQFSTWDRALAWRTIHLALNPRELFVRWMASRNMTVSPEKCQELAGAFMAGHLWTLFFDQMIQEAE